MENRPKRRKSGSGSFREVQRRNKDAGKEYVTKKRKNITAKLAPKQQVPCKCYFGCNTLSYERRKSLFKQFYSQNAKTQGTFLMGLISFAKIKRRRHGGYEDPRESQRQITICYTLSNENGEFVRVCKKTFSDTFAVTNKKLDILVTKKKLGESCYIDKRTNHKTLKYSEEDRQLVRLHINSIPRDVGHYSRAKSNKEYMSPDLNKHRLFKAFLEMHPQSSVTYKFYVSVFTTDFPNVSFRHPREDTCSLCDELHCEIGANIASSRDAQIKLEIHHRKAEKARDLLKQDMIASQQPGSITCCLSMDLEQVLFVPTLTHSNMFYLSQLSCYNLGLHIGDTNDAYMCMWHEGFAGRGSNEIASCLLHLLSTEFTHKKNLIIWCDNCGGQNKNKIVLFIMVFLVAHGFLDSVELKLLVSGHSFMPCDRDFAMIEKRKRVMKAFVPTDLHKVVSLARYTPPFKIVDMAAVGFWDIKTLADQFLNTTKLKISKAVSIKIQKTNPTVVQTKTAFSDVSPWNEVNILRKGKSMSDIKRAELRKLPPENKISTNKRVHLRSMIPYLENLKHKAFYRKLLDLEEPSVTDCQPGTSSQQDGNSSQQE